CKAVGLAPGTVHPIIYKFEEIGWLESRFEEIDSSDAGRPRRRYYRLTHDGAQFARDAPRGRRLGHALSLLRGAFVLRLRFGRKKKAANAAVRRAKG
ncbi:MAG: PadR family transcriptional regulator, partial [Gammaproteobacteria bacterium]